MNQYIVEKIRDYLLKNESSLDTELADIFKDVFNRPPKTENLGTAPLDSLIKPISKPVFSDGN